MEEEVIQLEIDEVLKLKGIYYIIGEIEEGDLKEIHQHLLLKTLNPKAGDEVTIILNSVGGECPEGWALIDLMEWARQNGVTVRTVGMGYICSMASCILAAGSPRNRLMTKNSSMMIHAPRIYGMEGNIHQIADSEKALKFEQNRHLRFWLRNSKYRSEKKVKEFLLNVRDNWFSPDEAMKHGIIDGVAGTIKIEE